MNTYIDTKELIPEILDLGWTVKNDTWTDCPWSIYDQLQADHVAYLIEMGELQHDIRRQHSVCNTRYHSVNMGQPTNDGSDLK